MKSFKKIVSVKKIGLRNCLDLEVNHPDHNYWQNDLLGSNSHAVAYAKTSALSVYLKFKYPKEFFLECLKLAGGAKTQAEEVAEITQELPFFGVRLLPPSLTKSDKDFTIEGGDIRFGLGAIKGISDKSISSIKSFVEKEKANLFDVFNAASQAKVNSIVLTALLEVGIVDDLVSFDRQKIVLMSKIWREMNIKEIAYCLDHGIEFKFDLIDLLKTYPSWIGANGKPIGTEKRLETLRKNTKPYFEIYRENIKNPMISQYLFEKKLLGYCPSITLSELFKEYPDLSKIAQIKTELYEGERLQVVAEVKEVKTGVAKKSQQKYARIDLSDETGNMTCLFTGEKWLNYLNKFGEPEEGQIIYIVGSKGKGEDPVIFAERGEVQHFSIFQRVNDLKKYQEKHGIEPEEVEVLA